MSQYQSRTGPIQNNAAAFSPEMVQGVTAPRPRGALGPKIGLPLFVFVAAFPFESILANQVDNRNHLKPPQQHLPPISQTTHVPAPFSTEMVAGTQGVTHPAPRLHLAPRGLPQPISQTTHVQAPFTPDMVAGTTVPKPRIFTAPRFNEPDLNFIPLFAFESVLGSRLDDRNHLTYPKHLPPIAQTTHVAAPFSTEMVQGATVPRPRLPRITQLPVPDLIFVPQFAFESVLGGRGFQQDYRSHLTYPKHLPPIAQTTHVAAPFSTEMVAGTQGVTHPAPRLHLAPRGLPQPISQTTHVQAPFTPDMVAGTTVPKPRIFTAPRFNEPDLNFIPLFAFESVLGSRLDDRNHLTYPKHLPPIAQTTHVSAPFSVAEMVISGSTIYRARLPKIIQLSVPDNVFVAQFAFESVLASRLDSRNHLTYPKHLPPIAQTTHVAAPFSTEMVQGATVPRPRLPRITQLPVPDLIFVPQFAFESVLSGRLDSRNHLVYPQHLAPIVVDIPRFAFESILAGITTANDIRSRIRRPQHLPPVLIDVVRFTFDSVLAGITTANDIRSRIRRPQHLAPISQTTHIQAPFSPEMILGVQGVRYPAPRIHLGVRIGLPISQVTHVAASSVTPEMWKGFVSIPPQLDSQCLYVWFTTTGDDWGVPGGIGMIGGINNPGAVSSGGRRVVSRTGIRDVKKTR